MCHGRYPRVIDVSRRDHPRVIDVSRRDDASSIDAFQSDNLGDVVASASTRLALAVARAIARASSHPRVRAIHRDARATAIVRIARTNHVVARSIATRDDDDAVSFTHSRG